MKHLGDITKIDGYSVPIVDCVVGGSPCQDLSIAGKRSGLAGERSGLYMEQIRLVKEMRLKDEHNGRTGVDVRPRYMVWENVPGAFSSNKGEDFRIVLEELAKIKDKDATIPMPDKGKWATSGCIVGDGWSIAWRVLDAQFWGVPQRRRRIALVADFGGQSAPEILFVRKSVSGHTDESKPKRKEAATDAPRGIGADDSGVKCLTPWDTQTRRVYDAKYTYPSLCSGENSGQNQQSVLIKKEFDGSVAYTAKIRGGCEGGGKGALVQTDKSATLSTLQDQILFQPVYKCFSKSKRAQSDKDDETWKESDTANTLNAFDIGDVRTTEAVVYTSYQDKVSALCARDYKGVGSQHVEEDKLVCYCLQGGGTTSQNSQGIGYAKDKSYTINTIDRHAIVRAVDCRNATEDTINGALQSGCYRSLNRNNVVRQRYIVRRLTPLECERLQGYPDGWTDIGDWTDSKGKVHKSSDAARYKALGNSIALPPWKWVLKRLCACYERDATMASLFDGIGGFPYLWEQLNGKGTCLWASEIEEFPMAVTKVRIG